MKEILNFGFQLIKLIFKFAFLILACIGFIALIGGFAK